MCRAKPPRWSHRVTRARPWPPDEKGFNVITLTDCCATTSAEGQKGATEGTYGMFSSPMTSEDFTKLM